MITKEQIIAWIQALQQIYDENKEYLTELDAAIGDADHGINLDRGFKAVVVELEDTDFPDISAILKTVAMTLIKTVGGASGPLYGTFFLRASTASVGKSELSPTDIVGIFTAGLEGVVQRGKAVLEDKTMVDAITPAVAAMQKAQENGSDLVSLMHQGTVAAEEGMRRTIPLQAKKGRASYLGKRSIGHQDPGATSAYMLFKAAAEVWGQRV